MKFREREKNMENGNQERKMWEKRKLNMLRESKRKSKREREGDRYRDSEREREKKRGR